MTALGVRRPAIVGCLVLWAFAGASGQQQAAEPRIGYAFPAGGQQGTTVTMMVGGRFLDGVDRVFVSGDGVAARVVAHDKPRSQRQLTELREKLASLQARAADAGVRREAIEIRAQIAASVQRNLYPALAEFVTIEVAIAGDAAEGKRWLRLHTPRGVTNPLIVQVGRLVEFREPDEKPADARAIDVTAPVTVNGRLIPREDERLRLIGRQGPQRYGDVDRYAVTARKGQELSITVDARSLMPYLGDAVPGWFQATVSVLDGRGREVAHADDFFFDPDPRLRCTIPEDGRYVIAIKDALYRGREDFVYRMAIDDGSARRAARERRTREPGAAEREPNDDVRRAQRLSVPAIVNGRIDRAGDWDTFRFDGRQGTRLVAEVIARRAGSPLDAVIELLDPAGRRVAANDDAEDAAWDSHTHDADSILTATLPASGRYTLRIGDVQRKGGAEYSYRLRLGPPRADFEARVAPSAINAAPGAQVPVTVDVRRIDGFDGHVTLALKNAPRGFVLTGSVPPGQRSAKATLTIPANVRRDTFRMAVVATATIAGRAVVKPALPADDMMQAFAYHHLVAADDLYVTVRGRR